MSKFFKRALGLAAVGGAVAAGVTPSEEENAEDTEEAAEAEAAEEKAE